jgi:hypothetical protein
MRRFAIIGAAGMAAAFLALPAAAGLAFTDYPVGYYDMPNGDGVAAGGTWNYWDAVYDGVGDVTRDAAPLRFGRGKLTDGVVAQQPWFLVSDSAGLGPHVGWRLGSATNPEIRFVFLMPTCRCWLHIQGVTIWLDNSGVGGVGAPREILVDGVPLPFVPPSLGSFGPVEISGFDNRGPYATLRFVQDPAAPWTMVSEVQWSGYVIFVPAPSSLGLFAIGLAGLALRRRAADTA